MALIAAAAEGEFPNPVAVFDSVDDTGLGKGVQSPIDGDPI